MSEQHKIAYIQELGYSIIQGVTWEYGTSEECKRLKEHVWVPVNEYSPDFGKNWVVQWECAREGGCGANKDTYTKK